MNSAITVESLPDPVWEKLESLEGRIVEIEKRLAIAEE